MSAHRLAVFDGPRRVGRLVFDSLDERFSFDYADSWLADADTYALSPHIPLSGSSAASSTVRRFLENLLPEGRALDVAAATHRVSKNNVFGLLRELGRETAGALRFCDEDSPTTATRTSQREVTFAELQQRIAERLEVPFEVWDGRVRLSIAGLQDKLAAYLDGERIFLVEGLLASTHILKPEPLGNRFPALVANEHFCLQLAAKLGLAAAPARILRVPDPLLAVQRFDRVRGDGVVLRLHIVDACQALDFPVAYKYERNFGSGADVMHIRDGVSFPRLLALAEHATAKALFRQALVRWTLFQYVIGNADAHGKNLSFFCRPDGLAVAPAYDLVSTVQYPATDATLAMAFGDAFAFDSVSPFEWALFAKHVGVNRAYLAREMGRMARAAPVAASELVKSAEYVGDERAMVVGVANTVAKHARQLADAIPPLRTVAADHL